MARALALLLVVFTTSALAGTEETPDQATPEPFAIDSTTAIKMTVAHAFDRAIARERIGYLLEYWSSRFGVQKEWRGDRVFLTGRVWGVEIKAVFTVHEKTVQAMAWDPGTMFASAAQRYVDRKLRKYLHPTYDEP